MDLSLFSYGGEPMPFSTKDIEGNRGDAFCPCGKDIPDGEFRLISIVRNFAFEFCRECVTKGLHLA
jgi:hypothetical protein